MEFSSKLLENVVYEIAQLPSIGKRTALRLALFILKQDALQTESLANALLKFRNEILFCEKCHNISDTPICDICKNPMRDNSVVCVVEDVRDVMAIESTGQYKGVYHILGGKISPIDGIGPNDLKITSLIEKAKSEHIKEIILALSNTMEGDTTNFYIFRQLEDLDVKVTAIARGISVGHELEYTDEVTLARSIQNRRDFNVSM